jgi:hypothetical protein
VAHAQVFGGDLMGVSWRASVAVGIVIDPDTFFFDVMQQEESLCAHSEAEGVAYCPVCGTPAAKRTKTVSVTVVKPPFRGLVEVDQEWEDGDDVGQLMLLCQEWNMGEDSVWVLGCRVGSLSSYDNGGTVREDAAATKQTIDHVNAQLAALGISETASTLLSLSAS